MPSAFSRRAFVAGSGALLTASALAPSQAKLPPPLPIGAGNEVSLTFSAAERPVSLPCFGGKSLPLWTFDDGAWPPVIRLDLGDRLTARVENRLPRADEHITVHWHGIRLPNDQDGVPNMTQPPIMPGESFIYSFTPPDTGTYFFHTHCNTAEQLGRGLMGVLIVEGDEVESYDDELLLAYRDWRIDKSAGTFLPFLTKEGAGRAGTFGTVRSVNGQSEPRYRVKSSADVRLRLLNADVTRIMEVGVIGGDAAVIAIDGVAVEPFALRSWRLGPAMRLDIAIRTPRDGGTARLVDYFSKDIVTLANFDSAGSAVRTADFMPIPLRAGRMPEPELAGAARIPLTFSATATGQAIAAIALPEGIPIDSLCLATDTFWAMNKVSWASRDHIDAPPPFAEMKRGQTYVLELRNATPHMHPIHLHGHTFKVLSSARRDLPAHHADTVLLGPKDRMDIAFVADNPGKWMLHCHIIEHQETGMMGYFTVA